MTTTTTTPRRRPRRYRHRGRLPPSDDGCSTSTAVSSSSPFVLALAVTSVLLVLPRFAVVVDGGFVGTTTTPTSPSSVAGRRGVVVDGVVSAFGQPRPSSFLVAASDRRRRRCRRGEPIGFAAAFVERRNGATKSSSSLRSSFTVVNGGDFEPNEDDDEEEEEEEDDDDEEEDPYTRAAASEFRDDDENPAVSLDWGGALSALRSRVSDVESGRTGPSDALFRTMVRDTPNETIGKFVSEADPSVVAAMSGAVGSLLGGLSNPNVGIETIVTASAERIGNLCFQLQMTGYMFRNAEYVLAIKDLMNLRSSATLREYKDAFDRLDSDNSGYIESNEVRALMDDVYGDGRTPTFEIDAFLNFFDRNEDGRVSWEEFERGLGAAMSAANNNAGEKKGLPGDDAVGLDDDDEEDDGAAEATLKEPGVSGKITVELEDGKVIEVEAKDYIDDLKKEAEALKEALRREKGLGGSATGGPPGGMMPGFGGEAKPTVSDEVGGVGGYIASLRGDVKSLTEGISPEVVEAMKMLAEYVIDGGKEGANGGRGKEGNDGERGGGNQKSAKETEMEIPGSALQQLALWQLVLGYRLREAEATGEYRKMLE